MSTPSPSPPCSSSARHGVAIAGRRRRLAALLIALLAGAAAFAQSPADTDESAYTPATLAKILGGAARSQNDEAELAAPGQWFYTTTTYTGHKRTPSGRYRPLVS